MEVLKYFPEKIEKLIIENSNEFLNFIEEIRIRNGRPIILKMQDGEKIIKYDVTSEDILYIIQHVCENSIYSYQTQISCGYVTVRGGHRVGISGSSVIENGKIININYIYSLNFRIAKEVIGSSKKVLKEIVNLEKNTVYNTLIVSVPGARKNNYFKRFDKTN